jgi:hypothetical protein
MQAQPAREAHQPTSVWLGQPIYYTGSHGGTDGASIRAKDAQTYADYISYDMNAPVRRQGTLD